MATNPRTTGPSAPAARCIVRLARTTAASVSAASARWTITVRGSTTASANGTKSISSSSSSMWECCPDMPSHWWHLPGISRVRSVPKRCWSSRGGSCTRSFWFWRVCSLACLSLLLVVISSRPYLLMRPWWSRSRNRGPLGRGSPRWLS